VALPKQHRLRSRKDFSLVYQSGDRYKSNVMTLRILRRQAAVVNSAEASPSLSRDVPTSRFGIAVGLKVSKRAVVRNKIKRQLQAALQQLLPRVFPGWDLVVIVHPSAIQCDYKQFLRELEQLLIKAEVLDGHS
jgi:ribonuclease P protein component